jgi:hypothetical protein
MVERLNFEKKGSDYPIYCLLPTTSKINVAPFSCSVTPNNVYIATRPDAII